MAAGDARAVESFYREYFSFMYAQARHITRRDEAFCLDVVQDAVLRVIRTVRPAAGVKQFHAWLRLVTQTAAYDLLKSESRRRKRETVAAIAGPAAEPEPDPDDRTAWLADQIARLDPQIVTMIRMRFEKRWTLARVAEAMGLSIGTVDGRLRRALNDLRDAAGAEDLHG